MPLKAVLASKSDVDQLPEALRSFYKEQNGRYILDAEGVVFDEDHEALNTKLAEFRDNNIRMKKDLEKFKDVDPDEYKRLKQDIAKMQQAGVKPDDIAATIAKEIEKATSPLQATLQAMQAERDNARKALETKQVEDALWTVAAKAGVREEAREFWLGEATKIFRRDESGELAAYRGDTPLFSKRRGRASEQLSAEEWALEIAPTEPKLALLYKQSNGAGAKPGHSGTQANGGRVVSRDNASAISSSLEDIAKGTVVVTN